MARTRGSQRANFDDTVRLSLLEDDADDIEAVVTNLKSEIRQAKTDNDAKVAAVKEDTDNAIDGLRKVLIGILISVTTACILLVVNIIIVGSQ